MAARASSSAKVGRGESHTSYGFERLWELGELGASVEFAVCLPWFRELFTVEEQEEAERRLVLHDFPLARRLAEAEQRPPAWAVLGERCE